MSGARRMLTYKRKRPASCSSLWRGTEFRDLPCESQSDKHNDSSEVPTLKNQKRYPTNLNCLTCGGGENLQTCESCLQPYHLHCLEPHLKAHKSSMMDTVNCINGQDMRQIEINSHQFPPSKVCSETASELTTENQSSGVPLQKCTNSVQEVFCSSVDAGFAKNDGLIEDGSVYQSVQKHSGTPVDNSGSLSCENVVTTGLTTALITFNRRSKEKADAARTDVFSRLLKKQQLEAANKWEALCIPAASCEASSQRGSSTDQPEIHGPNTRDRRESGEKVTNYGSNSSPHTPARSCSETESVRPLEIKTSTEKVITIATSLADELASEKALVQNILASKDSLGCSSHNGLADSSTKVASSAKPSILSAYQDLIGAESELDSSGRTDSNVATGKIAELKCSQASSNSTLPRPEACTIDCNVIPDLHIKKQTTVVAAEAPDSVLTAKNDAGNLREVSTRGEVLELFGTSGEKNNESQLSHHALVAKCTAPFTPLVANGRDHEHAHHMLNMSLSSQNKCLQLFTEDRSNGMLPSTCAQSLTAISSAEQRSTFSQGSEKNNIASTSIKTSVFPNLSFPLEGGTSSHIRCAHSSLNLNIRSGEYNQNTAVQSLSDMRRKMLFGGLNSHPSALGMSSNYLEKSEPNRNLWSDDELDFLWIGVRRYGRGHWDAMRQDPRLCFSPWRTARDLADRWEVEQYKLLNEYCMPQSAYVRPQDAYFDKKSRFIHPKGGANKEMVSAEPQLSLGDLYSQKEGGHFTSNIQNYQFQQPLWSVRSTNLSSYSSSNVGNLASDLFCLDGRVMHRSEKNGSMTGLSARNHLPHWLREATNIPTSRSTQPAPPVGAPLTHRGALKLVESFGVHSEPSSMMRNTRVGGGVLVAGDSQPSSSVSAAGAFTRRLGATESRGTYSRLLNKPDNLVVIDSDGSSEETVSDERNARS